MDFVKNIDKERGTQARLFRENQKEIENTVHYGGICDKIQAVIFSGNIRRAYILGYLISAVWKERKSI